MRFLRKFYTLDPADYCLLLQILILLPLTVLGLYIFGFRHFYAGLNWLIRQSGRKPLPGDETLYVHQALRWIRYMKRCGVFGGNCLSRSLVLWWLLYWRGIEANIQIGTCKLQGKFQAHAWVEHLGQPLNAGPQVRQRYVAFDHVFVPDRKRAEPFFHKEKL